jgi:hypothetical protein
MAYRTPHEDTASLDNQLRRMPDKLKRLRRKDWLRRAFGARSHGYRWGTVLPAPLLAARGGDGDELPTDFRRFVTEVGNGGAGPFYGWGPFEPSLLNGVVRKPFVADEGDDEDRATIMLHVHGCGMYDFLVLRGEGAGEVWFSDDRCRAHPYGLGFLDHLEAWLDMQLVKPGSFLVPRSLKVVPG